MKEEMKRLFEDCASVAEACEIQIEATREAFAETWPSREQWASEMPYRSLDEAIADMRAAFDRCISFGRAYGDMLSQRPDIASISDDEIYRVLAGLLSSDMPELESAHMPEETAHAARSIVRMALNERLTEIKLEAIARRAPTTLAGANSDDPIGDAGRQLGEMQALRAPHRFDVFGDSKMVEAVKDEAADLLPELRQMSADAAESLLEFILGIAAGRLAEIRASYTPAPSSNKQPN